MRNNICISVIVIYCCITNIGLWGLLTHTVLCTKPSNNCPKTQQLKAIYMFFNSVSVSQGTQAWFSWTSASQFLTVLQSEWVSCLRITEDRIHFWAHLPGYWQDSVPQGCWNESYLLAVGRRLHLVPWREDLFNMAICSIKAKKREFSSKTTHNYGNLTIEVTSFNITLLYWSEASYSIWPYTIG